LKQQARQQERAVPTETSRQQTLESRLTLQDVYASTLRARLVLLMGCGSSELVVSHNDDALGLVNGFLAAGATSVIDTLWPIDNADAEEFSQGFYRNAFATDRTSRTRIITESHTKGAETASGLLDISLAVQKAVHSLRMCKKKRCQKKSPEKRLGCHQVSPYHWAPFVAWGSWVCRPAAQ
jgi:CHAT domain-containing protein